MRIVLLGATGYTGRLVAERLAGEAVVFRGQISRQFTLGQAQRIELGYGPMPQASGLDQNNRLALGFANGWASDGALAPNSRSATTRKPAIALSSKPVKIAEARRELHDRLSSSPYGSNRQ